MMERREGDGTQWSPLLPSVLPWSSGTPSMTSQVVHFTGTPAMTSPMVHFSGTPTMTSQAVHFTGPPTMSSRVVNFTGTTTMTSQVGNFTGSPTMTSQVGNFSGSPTIPSQVGNFSGSQTIDCGGPSQLADHLSNYGFVSPTCESLTSANLLPYRPLFSPKRKCPIAWDEIPPPKLHITDEQMACRMKGLQISNAANLLTQQTQQPQKDDVTLVVCDEIRQLRMPDNILPAELLAKLERPSKALVVWKPPEQRAAELLQQTLKAKKKEEEKMEDDKKENANDQKPSGSAVYSFQPNNQTTSSSSVFSFQSNDQNSSSPSVYSFQPNDQRASTSSVYSFQPHPTLPNFSLDALNNNNTLFEAPVQQQPCTSNEDVEDMDV